jgi:L-asparaginase II
MRVKQRRGGVVEAEHEVSGALVRDDGRILERFGDLDAPVTWRSAAKPFQLEVSLPLTGHRWTDEEIAVGASSHWGETAHVAVVNQILARCGCGAEHLYCGADWPGHPAARTAALRETDAPRAVWNNCSGKHAFMAGACRAQGWPEDYRDPDHPLQVEIRANLVQRTGHPEHHVVDGCGLPCFVQPIAALGRAWATLASAVNDGGSLLGRIGGAMTTHARLAGGEHALDTVTMQRATQPVVAKVGAEGLICVAVPAQRVAVVIKVWTGNDIARAVALGAALERWFPGLVPLDAYERQAELKNVVGRVVGRRSAEWV